jgi:DNA-binding CsgD family transcriptional regulator
MTSLDKNLISNTNPYIPFGNSFFDCSNPLEIATYLLNAYHRQLFDTPLFFNYIIMADTELNIHTFHVNHCLMLSPIKLSAGFSFKEEIMGKTSISEAYAKNQTAILYPGDCDNSLFDCYTNCTVPLILENRVVGYLSAFILNSKYDEIAINYFLSFAGFIASNLKYYVLKSKLEKYMQGKIINDFKISSLSSSEKKVLHFLKQGYSNKEISRLLFISENTTKSHIKLISEKLSCSNRTQIALNTVLFEIREIVRDN